MAFSDLISMPLLDGLSTADRSRLADLFTRRVYPAGTTIMRQGEHCDSFFMIESGSVMARSSQRGVLASRGPGETLGEIAMFTGEPASATITTETDAVLMVAPQAELRALVEESPILACNLCRLLGRRLAAAGQEVGRGVLTLLRSSTDGPGIGFALNLGASLAHHLQQEVAVIDLSRTANDASAGTEAISEHPRERLAIVRPASVLPDRVLPLLDALARRYRYLLAWAPVAPAGPDAAEPLTASADRVIAVIPYSSAHRAALPAWLPAAGRTELAVVGAPEPRSIAMSEAIEHAAGLRVAALLPDPPQALRRSDAPHDWVLRHPGLPFSQATGRLARRLVGKTVGVAFGSGAGRGHAHIGVLQALERLGICPDFVCGTSIGAFVAGMYAYRLPFHEMELSIRAVGSSIRHWSLPVYSLMAGSRLDQAIRNAIPPELQIEDLALPCAGVAADLLTGEEVVLRRGSAWLSARACAGIPGVFPPTPLDGRLLVDGGVISPVPCRAAREMGADIVLGISLEVAAPHPGPVGESIRSELELKRRRRAPTWPVALLRCLDLLQHGLTRHCLEGADVPLRVFAPPTALTDFRGGPPFLEAGEQAVEAARERLSALLPWVGL